jgi:SAM-dependent methyltransferase
MKKGNFYGNLAFYYDFICSDRRDDVEILSKLINKHKKNKGNKLLDVACGSGLEDKYFKKNFKVRGVDKNRGVLRIAKNRNPEVTYKSGDMRNFKLDEKFDVITCFDAMNYLMNYDDLKKTIKNFSEHLNEGGLLVFYLDTIKEHFNQNDVKITHKSKDDMDVILIENWFVDKDDVGETYLIFIIRKDGKSEIKVDKHEWKLFEREKIKEILEEFGFKTYLYAGNEKTTFSTTEYYKESLFPIFVCEK